MSAKMIPMRGNKVFVEVNEEDFNALVKDAGDFLFFFPALVWYYQRMNLGFQRRLMIYWYDLKIVDKRNYKSTLQYSVNIIDNFFLV